MPVQYNFPPPEQPDWYWRILVMVIVASGVGVGIRGCLAIDDTKIQLERIQSERSYFNARLEDLKERIEDTNATLRRLVLHIMGVGNEDPRHDKSNMDRPQQFKLHADPKKPFEPIEPIE